MPPFNPTVWIVHQDAGSRAALARGVERSRARHQIVAGRPTDAIFESAPTADLVILGIVSADFEAELEFARWTSERAPTAAWILVAEARTHSEARRLFDTIEPLLVSHPPTAAIVADAVERAIGRLAAEPLSRRLQQDLLASRFARWFGRDEPADLARALEPRLASRPMLVRGEPGTGRGLLLRYAHTFASGEPGPFARVSCREARHAEDLFVQIADGVSQPGGARPGTTGRIGVWLEDLDQLAFGLPMQVLDWMEFGLPAGVARGSVRWLASAGDPGTGLEPRLEEAFAAVSLRLLPLRARPSIIEPFVEDTARTWSSARGEKILRFDAEALRFLREDPWPGNLRALEACVIRTLAHAGPDAETLHIGDLRLDASGEEWATPAPAPAPRTPTAEDQPAAGAEPSTQRPGAEAAPGAAPGSPTRAARTLQRLAGAIAHEVRNPLVSIRTFSELLPEHYADEEFRSRFSELVGEDVRRIETAVASLQSVADATTGEPGPVDVTALLDELLAAEAPRIEELRLLVLKELDQDRPTASADRDALREAFAAILRRALVEVPERGDLYVASKHHAGESGAEGRASPTLRVLFRYHTTSGEVAAGGAPMSSLRETVLDHAVAEAVISRQGGTMTIDNTDASETVILVDLPAPRA